MHPDRYGRVVANPGDVRTWSELVEDHAKKGTPVSVVDDTVVGGEHGAEYWINSPKSVAEKTKWASVHNVQRAVCSAQCAVCSVQCAVYCVQCTPEYTILTSITRTVVT